MPWCAGALEWKIGWGSSSDAGTSGQKTNFSEQSPRMNALLNRALGPVAFGHFDPFGLIALSNVSPSLHPVI